VTRLLAGRPGFDSHREGIFFSAAPRPELFCGPSSLLSNGGTGEGGLSLGEEWPGSEAYNSPPSNTKVKNSWSYISTPQYVFRAWQLVTHRDNITDDVTGSLSVTSLNKNVIRQERALTARI
jgi:hypothetical protein